MIVFLIHARSNVSANAISGAFNIYTCYILRRGLCTDVAHCRLAFVRINCVSLFVSRDAIHTWLRMCARVCFCVYRVWVVTLRVMMHRPVERKDKERYRRDISANGI